MTLFQILMAGIDISAYLAGKNGVTWQWFEPYFYYSDLHYLAGVT